jgi:hypothetical protein
MLTVVGISKFSFYLETSRVTRFFEKIAQFFYIFIKALFESTKHFETLKYLQQTMFESAYLGYIM